MGERRARLSADARFPVAWPGVRVTTAAEARALDAEAVARGVPSRALMRVAGHAAASEITRRNAFNLARGVAVYAGPGNNGGDACVVAQALAAAGVAVSVRAVGDARTDDGAAERAEASRFGFPDPHGGEGIIVDGVLGIGARGAPTGEVAAAIAEIRARRAGGATIVALDVPSGLDADTGEGYGELSVEAHCTLAFGSCKRGLLVARARAGAVVVLDIGLGGPLALGVPLAEGRRVHAMLPAFAAAGHKGTRGKVLIVGGAPGMSGAVILAARASLAAGAGMVKVVAHAESLTAIQAAVPSALTAPWPRTDAEAGELMAWADACVIGPGLGVDGARALVTRLLTTRLVSATPTRVVLDADALNAFAFDVRELARVLSGHSALITPHPAEFARLTGTPLADVLATRFEAGRDLARVLGCAVLFKGVPTIVSSASGGVAISATGTPALSTGGSGDVLSGIAGTLLTQLDDAANAGVLAAWLHGRAAEVAQGPRSPRAITLDDVVVALPSLWDEAPETPRSGVLTELPAVRER